MGQISPNEPKESRPMSLEVDAERVKKHIETLADNYFLSGGAYLLSKLGLDLGDDLKVIKAGPERSLANFIRVHFSEKYTVVYTGEHRSVQALLPAAERMDDVAAAGERQGGGARYNHRFWAAFSVPATKERRWLNMETMIFQDSADAPSQDFIEVEHDYIAPEDCEDRDEVIKDNISRWLKKNNISVERVVQRRSAKNAGGLLPHSSKSLLEAIVETLDAKQLASTHMSLDVVAVLLRKRR